MSLLGLGFAIGARIFELLPMADKSRFWDTYKWCVASCARGAGIVCVFGPMLIVFGMFVAGTLSLVLHEIIRARGKSVSYIPDPGTDE